MWRGARAVPTLEGLDDDHVPAAAWAWRSHIHQLDWWIGSGGWCDSEQLTDMVKTGLAGGAREQTVMADAVEPAWQDVEQEAADELVGGEGHDLLPVGTGASIILVAERDAGVVEAHEAAVRDRDPVRIARQVGEHRLSSGERRPFDKLRRSLA
jgi:hypothetical protein